VLPGIDEVLGGGGDFDQFVVGVGEVEEEGLRAARVAAPADAGEDFAGRHLGIAGVSDEHGEGAVDGVAAGEETVLMGKTVSEPLAETAREDGPAEATRGAVGDDDPGMAKGGGKRARVFDGVVEDEFGAGFLHGYS
jgi:hypothetical protein